jgi:hypothetical protein
VWSGIIGRNHHAGQPCGKFDGAGFEKACPIDDSKATSHATDNVNGLQGAQEDCKHGTEYQAAPRYKELHRDELGVSHPVSLE